MQNNTWEEFKNKKIELFNKELKIFLEKINGIRSNQISLEVIRRLTISCQKEIKPVNALANLKVSSNELIIKPFDPKMLSVIEKAILDSQLGYNTEKKTKEEIYFSLSPINTEIKKTLIKKANQISQETNKWFRLIYQDLKN
jgi:ribosome recycling factor